MPLRRTTNLSPEMKEYKHGYNRYCRGCRCDICKEAKSVYQRGYRQRNHLRERERQNEAGVRYRESHPEKIRIARQAWLRSPRGKISNSVCVTRYRKQQNIAPGNPSNEAILARIAFYGTKCWMCGGPYEALDHVIPLSKGGTNWPANLRPACKSCNSRKRDRDWRLFVHGVITSPGRGKD